MATKRTAKKSLDHNQREHQEAIKRKESNIKGMNEHNRKEHEEAVKRRKDDDS